MGSATSWIQPRLLRGIATPTVEELTQGSLYEWMLRTCGTRLVRAHEDIEAAPSPRWRSGLASRQERRC